MKRTKTFLVGLCVGLMVLGIVSSVNANPITIGPNTVIQWRWVDPPAYSFSPPNSYDNPNAYVVSTIVGEDVDELYRGNNNGSEVGPLTDSYATSFTPGNEGATISYGSGNIVSASDPAYLLVRDGNNDPMWYIYDLHHLDLTDDGISNPVNAWNGEDSIIIAGLWPNNGSISHVALLGSEGTAVPEPGTLLLLGFGLTGLGAYGLRKRVGK